MSAEVAVEQHFAVERMDAHRRSERLIDAVDRIEHETGFIFQGAEVVSARELRVASGSINFEYADKAGFVTEVHYHN